MGLLALVDIFRFGSCSDTRHIMCVSMLFECSTRILSNNSKSFKETLQTSQEFGEFLDILAVSCDSFQEATNMLIGRGEGNHLEKLENIHQWCQRYKVLFKINSVINKHNVHEDPRFLWLRSERFPACSKIKSYLQSYWY